MAYKPPPRLRWMFYKRLVLPHFWRVNYFEICIAVLFIGLTIMPDWGWSQSFAAFFAALNIMSVVLSFRRIRDQYDRMVNEEFLRQLEETDRQNRNDEGEEDNKEQK